MSEGRRVAAALVAVEPMTRGDASLYTDEPLANLVTPRDVKRSLALANDVLPEDRVLLGDGLASSTSSSTSSSSTSSSSTSSSSPAAQQLLPEAQLYDGSQRAQVGYGVPGVARGSTPTSGPASPGAAEGGSGRSSIRPGSESQLVGQQADRGKRKSGAWNGGEGKNQ